MCFVPSVVFCVLCCVSNERKRKRCCSCPSPPASLFFLFFFSVLLRQVVERRTDLAVLTVGVLGFWEALLWLCLSPSLACCSVLLCCVVDGCYLQTPREASCSLCLFVCSPPCVVLCWCSVVAVADARLEFHLCVRSCFCDV